MTFEERMDRLTERHEALAQSLELLRLEHETQRHHLELLRESTADLLKVARMHETRLNRLEQNS